MKSDEEELEKQVQQTFPDSREFSQHDRCLYRLQHYRSSAILGVESLEDGDSHDAELERTNTYPWKNSAKFQSRKQHHRSARYFTFFAT